MLSGLPAARSISRTTVSIAISNPGGVPRRHSYGKASPAIKGPSLISNFTPKLAIAMLACARIGATHSVIFGGFSSAALIDRINDASCKAVVTADGGWRRGKEVKLKAAVDEALKQTPSVKTCIVVRRTGERVLMATGRDHWWHELMANENANCPAAELDSEHPLYILYTSGTTGKPKGILHTTAGYLLQAHLTTKWVFDLKDE